MDSIEGPVPRHRPTAWIGLGGWLLFGLLLGGALVGFFFGLILLIPAAVLLRFLTRRELTGRWMTVAGVGVGMMLLLMDDLSTDATCDDWVGQSCRGINMSSSRVAFFMGAGLLGAGLLGQAISSRRTQDDTDLRL